MKRIINNTIKLYHGTKLNVLQKILREREFKLPGKSKEIILLKDFSDAIKYSTILLEIIFNPYVAPEENDFEINHDCVKLKGAIPLANINLVKSYSVEHNNKVGPYSQDWVSNCKIIATVPLLELLEQEEYGKLETIVLREKVIGE